MKKLFLILASLMCIMLCACGASEGSAVNNSENGQSSSENGQTNSEDTNDVAEFAIVGEWKFLSTGSSVTFKEDGTYESYLGGGFTYQDKSDSNMIAIDMDGLGFAGVGVQDFNILQEDGTYKLQSKNVVLVPASEYERLSALQGTDEETESEAKSEPTPIDGIYWLCQDKDASCGYYFDGNGRYVKVDANGKREGKYSGSESTTESSSEGTVYLYYLTPDTTSGSVHTSHIFFTHTADGKITCKNWIDENEYILQTFMQVDESTFYKAFNLQ